MPFIVIFNDFTSFRMLLVVLFDDSFKNRTSGFLVVRRTWNKLLLPSIPVCFPDNFTFSSETAKLLLFIWSKSEHSFWARNEMITNRLSTGENITRSISCVIKDKRIRRTSCYFIFFLSFSVNLSSPSICTSFFSPSRLSLRISLFFYSFLFLLLFIFFLCYS